MSESKAKKNVAIEKIYQKKTPLEHILLRPDTYIGSIEFLQQEMWIWDLENERMIKKEIKFVPGLFKIFDEILVNAADNKQRDANMSVIKITINKEENMIKIYNNGKGIPVVEHKDEKVYVPSLIFGHLLTSSNYDDDVKKVTGGRNGYGAKLCNIFSKKFIVETSCHEYRKSFKQTWTNNMNTENAPVIKESKADDFTCVTFYPDLSKFKMSSLDDDTIGLLARRAYDIAASTRGVKVYLNDKKLPINKFEDYCKLYLMSNSSTTNEFGEGGPPSNCGLISDKPNVRWEVALCYSDIGFQQVSFVNSIATTKGGRHVDYVCDQIIKHLGEAVNKKNKNGTQVKPFQIKQHLWVFVNCQVENPTFDSQTKETLTLQVKNFGSKCQLSDEFYKKLNKSPIVDHVLNWLAFKEKTVLENSGPKTKQSKLKGIAKLDDANNAGTKDSMNCTLILTEGDSAKTLAVAGLGVIGRDRYGVFPLRGKMLNVREATFKQILDNAEISSICKIVGLNFKEKYETRDSLRNLRYGKIMIMTDQDHDGSHIKGLIINFIHNQWPNLLRYGFIEEFITPIVKVSKPNADERQFFSIPEFEEWRNATPNWYKWKIKYYKGLGTSTSKEAKEYFSNMSRHRITFDYKGKRDDLAIQLAFSKRFIEERKEWLTRYMSETKSENDYLYQKYTKSINYTDFVNKELVLFSNLDNERSIPSLVDGFKPGQRKVLFSCFKRNLQKEIKVAQLAGSVAELSSYHHGEQSLMSTIINLAHNFVGSNNINLLMPIGQFGTRLYGGKDAASPRYIFTQLSSMTRLLINSKDDPLLSYINDDGARVEPHFYCPIIPLVLVNGAEGIGTGWSTKIPNFNPRDIIKNIKRMINDEEPTSMIPYYKGFRGAIKHVDDNRVITSGVVSTIGEHSVEITELPIGVWTQVYKESVLEAYLYGTEKDKEKNKERFVPLISDYKEYHTDSTVRFVVRMTKEQYSNAEKQGFHKYFKLQKMISLQSMVLFDHKGCLKRYESATHILKEFYGVRLGLYEKRKAFLEDKLKAESSKLNNVARFIVEKVEGKLKIENLKKKDVIKLLVDQKFDTDPVNKWKANNKSYFQDHEHETLNAEEDDSEDKTDDFNYLLSMPLWNLTLEKKDEILKQQKQKLGELNDLRAKTVKQLWIDDLDEFMAEFEKIEKKEKEDFESGKFLKQQQQKIGRVLKNEYLPSSYGDLVDPAYEAQPSTAVKEKTAKEDYNIVDLIYGKFKNPAGEEIELGDTHVAKYMQSLQNPVKQKKEVSKKAKPAINDAAVNDTIDSILNSALNETQDADKSTTTTGNASTTATPKKRPKANGSPKEKTPRKKKRTNSSDEEISVGGNDGNSDDDDRASIISFKIEKSESLTPRQTTGRARKPVKYNFGENEDEDEVGEEEKETDFRIKKPAKAAKVSSDEDVEVDVETTKKTTSKDGDSDVEVKTPKKRAANEDSKKSHKKPTPAKKTPKKAESAAKKNAFDFDEADFSGHSGSNGSDFKAGVKKNKKPVSSDDDDEIDVETTKVKKKTPVKKPAVRKRASNGKGDEDNEAEEIKKKPTSARKTPPAKAKPIESEEDNDFSVQSDSNDSDFKIADKKKRTQSTKRRSTSNNNESKSTAKSKELLNTDDDASDVSID